MNEAARPEGKLTEAQPLPRLKIDQIADDFEFRKRPSMADIFDDSLLPAVSARKIN